MLGRKTHVGFRDEKSRILKGVSTQIFPETAPEKESVFFAREHGKVDI